MVAAVDRLTGISVGLPSQLPDEDPAETQEWLESLDGLVDHAGRTRARALLLRVLQRARERQVDVPSVFTTDYVNTIAAGSEPEFPGDESVADLRDGRTVSLEEDLLPRTGSATCRWTGT
jgi:pyruvate dehydrogenase E1 component